MKEYEVRCPYCSKRARLLKGRQLYFGSSILERVPELGEAFFYRCRPCDATVGCHKGTNKPLGTLANAVLRKLRKDAHDALDPLWRAKGKAARGEAYAWLRQAMGLKEDECHIGLFNEEQCRRVVELCDGR